MQQVLFRIPSWSDNGLPIYGFGFMMVVALYASVILAGHRAQKEGIPKETLWDLAIWLSYAVSGGSAFLLCGRRHIRYWLPERENRLLEDLPELGAMEW